MCMHIHTCIHIYDSFKAHGLIYTQQAPGGNAQQQRLAVQTVDAGDRRGSAAAFWRVGWNLTGTTLAASAENGQVREFVVMMCVCVCVCVCVCMCVVCLLN
jgi:hypothetical protein